MLTRLGFLTGVALSLVFVFISPASAQNNILFIFDASGSMKTPVGGGDTRISAAKRAMSETLSQVPKDTRVGLMMYGHRRANDCTDIELLSPIGADEPATVNAIVQKTDPKGETPIAVALRQAARNFATLKGQNNSIVLVTDGIEECHGDPCAAAREIKAAGLDLKVHIVGFTLNDQQRKAIQCVPDATGGKFFEARDAASLSKALGDVRQQIAQNTAPPAASPPPAPSALDLLATKNGGQLLVAPNDIWKKTNDGSEQPSFWYDFNSEAVYGFKDGRPATLSSFSVLIPQTYGGNLKDFELLVGNDGPTGSFRSIGSFTAQNVKLMATPYQEFKFPEVTAKYLKVKLLSCHEGKSIQLYQFRAMGKLAESTATAPAVATPASGTIDLIATKNGGQLLVAPNDIWKKTNDGREEESYWYDFNSEAVFGFRNEQPATFSTFSVLIPRTYGGNLKDFELLVGNDGPTGSFRSIGSFTTQNVKLMATPYQEFKFPEVTAKYLKVKLLSCHDGKSIQLYQFRLLGQPKP